MLPFFLAGLNTVMRATEFTEVKRKPPVPKAGDTTPHDWTPWWQRLNYLKKEAQQEGERLSKRYQLFIPRGIKTPNTSEISKKFLQNKYAWDDEGNLHPEYEKYYDPRQYRKEYHPAGKTPELSEAAPVLNPAKVPPVPGRNKPTGSFLWTSTAYKMGDKWSSDWNKWIISNQPDWSNKVGYLYKVKPGALILRLNSDYDVEEVYDVFRGMGRIQDTDDKYKYGQMNGMQRDFPWQEISKHFDAVTHQSPYSRGEFLYGWDVESTVWFDPGFLHLVGEVPVSSYDSGDNHEGRTRTYY
jgi:hypothetical protein